MVASALLLCAYAEGQLIRDELPEQEGVGVVDRTGDKLPLDAAFINASGDEVTLGDYFDGERPVLVVPAYYDCPMLCPLTQEKVADAMRQMEWTAGDEYRVVTFSFDHTEGPITSNAKQKLYVGRYTRAGGAAEREVDTFDDAWAFLTSDATTIRRVTTALGFHYRFVPESGEFSHTSAVFFCSPDGTIHNFIEGLDYTGERFTEALRSARDGEQRTLFDRVYAWCFPYDPNTGENTASAFRFMQLGGALVALGLFSTIGWLFVRSARKGAAFREAREA